MNASRNPQNSRAGKRRAPGLSLLHLACCGLPLLIVFGASGAIGALLANPGLIAGALVLAVLVGVVVAARMVSRRNGIARAQDDCCLPLGRAEESGDIERVDASATRHIAP